MALRIVKCTFEVVTSVLCCCACKCGGVGVAFHADLSLCLLHIRSGLTSCDMDPFCYGSLVNKYDSQRTEGGILLVGVLKMCACVVLAAPITGLWQSLCPPALSGW